MKKYQILYRFKGNHAYNDLPYNEGFIQASTKKRSKRKVQWTYESSWMWSQNYKNYRTKLIILINN